MQRLTAVIIILCMASSPCSAGEAEEQAKSFIDIYASLCLKNLSNLEALREQLKPMPKLPPEKAAAFLAGRPGDAWPVPDKHGTFVLTLLSGKNFCTVYARRASTDAAKRHFVSALAGAPSPLTSKQVKNEQTQAAANGRSETISYEWSVPNASRKMLFTLTTASSDSAQFQVLGSAAIIGQ